MEFPVGEGELLQPHIETAQRANLHALLAHGIVKFRDLHVISLRESVEALANLNDAVLAKLESFV